MPISEEKHEPVSDIDAAVVDSLKALDPNRPIREADIMRVSTRTARRLADVADRENRDRAQSGHFVPGS